MKRLVNILLCVILLINFTSCNNPEEDPSSTAAPPTTSSQEEYPYEVDESTVIRSEPLRVASLSPSLTEIVYTLGYGDKLVAVSDSCDYPPQTADLPAVGSIRTPDLEQLEEISPDYLLVSSGLLEDDLAQIQRMGIVVVKIPPADSLWDLRRVYQTLGAVLGGRITGAQKGVDLYSIMATRIFELRTVLKRAGKSCYLIRMLDNTVATGDTFAGDILHQMGLINLAEDSTGWALAADEVEQTNPDILFVDKSVDVELVKLCPLYQNSNAVKNNAIYQVDMLLFERQSKRMMQELEVMALLAYPEGFQGSAT